MKIIGREMEQQALSRYLKSGRPEFVAVYGRRRIGKTFLIREYFHDHFAFYLTGATKGDKDTQIGYFNKAMRKYGGGKQEPVRNWADAFAQLEELLTRMKSAGRKVIFFDELPWLDTHKSGFLSALEHFWNSYASARPEIFLIICGSAASWIIKKVLKNRGGLHNRVTRRMPLKPFTLAECEEFFIYNDMEFDRRSVAESYMIFGGVPYYLSLFDRGRSLAQNVDAICFSENAPLTDEFEEIFYSLFNHADLHIKIIKTLARKKKGLYREEIAKDIGVISGGGLTDALNELEQSGFLSIYDDYSGKHGRFCFRLTDAFSLFYLTYMSGRRKKDIRFWSNFTGQTAHNSWRGYAFEQVCLTHIAQIKDALGISGVSSSVSAWRNIQTKPGAQIDLILNRNDGVINLCEIKYSADPYIIDKKYSDILKNKQDAFRKEVRPKKTLHLTMITSSGLKTNAYSNRIQFVVTLDQLFRI